MSYVCQHCGHMKDTAPHELGCPVGRGGLLEPCYAEGEAGYWHRRYDEQHRTLHDAEDVIADLRSQLRGLQTRYAQLQEQTGSAIYRAHVMRGDRELSVAKLAEQLEILIPLGVREVKRAPKLPPEKQARRIRLVWEPHDLWVGVYRDPANRRTYVCLLPCVVLLLEPRD